MIPAIANHLWQSTLFAAAAGLLTLALRRNHARTRYCVWLAASVKFLLPFSLLVTLGSHIEWRTAPEIVQPVAYLIVEEASQPFMAVPKPAAARIPTTETLPAVWTLGFLVVVLYWGRKWLRMRAAVRAASPMPLAFPVPVRSSTALMEPGVFGIFRPVLVLPAGIADRLTPVQLEAILAHELCHVRHRDNLASTMHMFVEAIFWFHPLVWWLGARLVEERERACDEEVLRLGSEPQVYAEGILTVCEFCLESPLTCVAGVTGSDLIKRMERIMRHRAAEALNGWKKIVLATTGAAALAVPVLVGTLTAPPRLMAQSSATGGKRLEFEVASIKPNKSPDLSKALIQWLPSGRFISTNVPLIRVIAAAWDLPLQSQRVTVASGGRMPDDIYDIEATAEKGTFPPGVSTMARYHTMQLMLQALLEDRFKLRIRREPKEQLVYALVVGKGGPKLEKSKFQEQNCSDTSPTWVSNPACHFLDGGQDRGLHGSVTTTQVVEYVNNFTDRPLLDKTGLTGFYDIQTEGWAPMRVTPDGAPQSGDASVNNPDRPTLFNVFEKLGLRMESQKAVIDMYVIDHVERPSEN